MRRAIFAPVVLAAAASAVPALGQIQFIRLGFLDGTSLESYAWGVSADGTTVVGESSSLASGSQTQAFRWTGGVMQGLGALNPENFASVANACSADGGVVVGFSRYTTGVAFQAFRAPASGIGPGDGLGDLPGGALISNALACSADGSIVVGFGTGAGGRQAFRYNATTGQMVAIGGPGTTAYGVSADGTVAVGQSLSTVEAILWTTDAQGNTSATVLPDLPGGLVGAEAWGVSHNGMIVVGDSESANGLEACYWAQGQVFPLGDLPGGVFSSSALASSMDGQVIVGYGSSASSGFLGEAVYWDHHGVNSIMDQLVAAGIDLQGFDLLVANGVSADGRVIVGNGTNGQGRPEAWMVILPAHVECPFDLNADGILDPDDLADFIAGYFMDPPAPFTDWDGNTIIDPDDLADYIAGYFLGCE